MKRVLALQVLALVLAPVLGAQELTIRHFAGSVGGRGAEDGPVSRARLASPRGVAVDAEGNIFVADAENHTIRRISAAGVVTTLAGLAGNAGSADGKGSSAQFNAPRGVAVDAAGIVYVADTANSTIRKIMPGGVVSTLAGAAGRTGYGDGDGTAASFWSPVALAIEASGNLLVADTVSGRIRRVTPTGTVTTLTLADGETAHFSNPAGVAADAAGNVYVAEGGQASVITRITPSGVQTTIAGLRGSSGSQDGTGSGARFWDPSGVVSDPMGNLWIADAGNGTIRAVTPEGVVTTIAGLALVPGCEDGAGSAARFNAPVAIARGADGTLAVADRANSAIRKVTPLGVVTTAAGGPRRSGSEDGQGAAARFNGPRGVAYDGLGNAFVADAGSSTIRKVTPQGVVSTVAGLAGVPGDDDGSGGSARFRRPTGVAVDAAGNVFVTDETSHTIRKVTPDGIVTTVAGQALAPGSNDGTGKEARFHGPAGIASDAAGILYVADRWNHTLRKVSPEGAVTTLAGQAGTAGSADGTGPAARFNELRGVAVLGSGDVWVTDSLNRTIRRVTAAGVVTTIAGSAGRFGAMDGAGPTASFAVPAGIAATAAGEALVVDSTHGTIRRVTEAGVVTTAAGRAFTNGTVGARASFDGTGESVRFNDPWGIASGPEGEVLVTDASDHAIRLGERTLPDAATIDAPAGPVGVTRQLRAPPEDATGWLWDLVRIEAGSTASLSSATAPDAVFTPDTDGLYVFRLTASDGSFRRISTVALAAGTVFPTAVAYGHADVCGGTPAAIRAELTGTPPWSLTWSDGIVQSDIVASPAERYVTVTPAWWEPWATYRVLAVSDAQGAGSSSGSSIVDIETVPRATVSGGGVVCDGRSKSIPVSVSGSGPITLTWSDGVTVVVGQGTHERIVNPSSVTTYSVTSVSNARCVGTSSGSATVTPIPLPTATVSGATTICAGQSAELQVDLTGMGPWRVVWSDGLVQNSVPESPYRRLVSPGTTSTYTVDAVSSVADPTCTGPGTGSATVTVLLSSPPDVSITSPSPVAPNATGLVASVPGAGPGATYAWTITNGTITAGQGTPAITYSVGGLGLTPIVVTVAVPGGCPASGATWSWVGVDPTAPVYFSRLAGPTGGGGWFDGPGATATFLRPEGVAADAAGNVYVLDGPNRTVRKLAPDGRVSTLAGLASHYGTADGQGATARFYAPLAIAATAAGEVYIADTSNHTIRRIGPSGVVSTFAGIPGTWGGVDGGPGVATFWSPSGIAVDGDGNVFVADTKGHTIRKVTPAGIVSTIAGMPFTPGSGDGVGGAAQFRYPEGLAVDSSGNVYVADTGNHTIRKISASGAVTTLAGVPRVPGSLDGIATQAYFRDPGGVAVDGAGRVFVADTGNRTIRLIASGEVTTLAGLAGTWGGGDDGAGSAARFLSPTGIALEAAGTFVISDSRSVRRMTATGVVSTVSGRGKLMSGFADGPGPDARFWFPADVVADRAGNTYVVDTNFVIRKVSPTGVASTLAGAVGECGFVDGPAAVARFCEPYGIAVDASGALYVADIWNHAIRKVSPAGVVTTLAGDGRDGSRDGAGRLARFYEPWGLAVDAAGNVWVADSSNHTLRKITPSRVVTTVAGLAGQSGSSDGTGSAARFEDPAGVAVDRLGNVYVADYGNATIRKVTPAGVVTTLAGSPGRSGREDGTGSAARFNWPTGLRVDGSGNIYVADRGNAAIRKVTPDGLVTTLGGSSGVSGGADGTGGAAQIGSPLGVAVLHSGELVLTDTGSHALWVGVPSLADAATIDAPTGPVGAIRQLGVSQGTATTWLWEIVRTEAASTAVLSSTTISNPTFTPDVAGTYRFRLTASNGDAKSITLVSLFVDMPPPTAHVTGGGLFCPGQPVQMRVDLTGIPPMTVVWSDGEVWNDLRFPVGWKGLTAVSSTTVSVVSVSDATGPGIATGSAVIEVPAPTATPVVQAPAVVGAGSPNRRASVVAHAGSTYSWWIVNGTITSGWGTNEVVFTGGEPGPLTLKVQETATEQCSSALATASVSVLPPGSATLFYPVTPCRVIDTRENPGLTGGEPVEGGATTLVDVAGTCGVPATARAVAANVTVTEPAATGQLVLYPGDEPKPVASMVSFAAGRTRASNAQLKLSTDGLGQLAIANESAGSAHVILDVSGYYQ